MRIRRNAPKLLGSASAAAYANPWPPSPAPVSTSGAAAPPEEELTVCELNRSPWDVLDINLCNFLANPKEGEDGGFLGNSLKTEVDEPISAVTSTAAGLTLKENKKVKRKERKKICSRLKETVVTAKTETVTYCKKSDGKGWHCKRLAQLPSSFCGYHLAQIRSYSSNHSHRGAADASAAATSNGNGKNLHMKSAAAVGETGGAASNFYYYYNGFGPWRSKRRGRDGVNGACVKVMENVKEDMDSKESVINHGDNDSAVAGDDEYDLDCFDQDDDEDDNLYNMPQKNEANGMKEGEIEKKNMVKKRGRKPFKCRSLKSLIS